jgi:hypothetical protein
MQSLQVLGFRPDKYALLLSLAFRFLKYCSARIMAHPRVLEWQRRWSDWDEMDTLDDMDNLGSMKSDDSDMEEYF